MSHSGKVKMLFDGKNEASEAGSHAREGAPAV